MKYRKDGRGRYKLIRKDSPAAVKSYTRVRAGFYAEAIGHGLLFVGAAVQVLVIAGGHHWWAVAGYALLLLFVLLRFRG